MEHDDEAAAADLLLSALTKSDLAFICERPGFWVAQRVQSGQLEMSQRDTRAWRRFSSEQVLAAIWLSSLGRAGVPPSKAAEFIRKGPDVPLSDLGLSLEQAEIVREAVHRAIARARQLPRRGARAREDEKREAAMLKAQEAIRDLPSESQKVALYQDLTRNINPEFVIPTLLLAVGELGEEEKKAFLVSFLSANREVWANVVLNTLSNLDHASKQMIAANLFEQLSPRREALGTEICVGEHASRGVHVSPFEERVRLLVSAGGDDLALAALLSPADAEQVLEAWRAELASGNGGEESTEIEASLEPAPVTAVQVLPGRAIRISAGASGSIVASLSETAAKVVFNSLEGAIDDLRGRQDHSNVFSIPLRPGVA